MSLQSSLFESIHSGEAGIWLRSAEPDAAIITIHEVVNGARDWSLLNWNVVQGASWAPESDPVVEISKKPGTILDVFKALYDLAAIRLPGANAGSASEIARDPTRRVIVVLRNGHREFTTNAVREIVTGTNLLIEMGKQTGIHLIWLVPPGQNPPAELTEQLLPMKHELPDEHERSQIIANTAEMEQGSELTGLTELTAGLTRGQIESAIATSMHLHGRANKPFIWRRKMSLLNDGESGVTLFDEPGKFDAYTDADGTYVPGLGGLSGLKQYTRRVFSSSHSVAKPRGLVLVGVPGGGKSHFAKALGNEIGRPTIRLQMSRLVTSAYGGTENRMMAALDVADAMSPTVLFIDEAEKALSGASSDGGDSGTTRRTFGGLMEWLNDHKSQVYVILTCNDISKFPSAFLRAGRFDVRAFVDVPTREQKDLIWEMYIKYYLLEPQELPDDAEWTGAEIKECCNQAAMLGIPLTSSCELVQPIAKLDADSLSELRNWAKGRCMDAETGLLYGSNKCLLPSNGSPKRKITRRT